MSGFSANRIRSRLLSGLISLLFVVGQAEAQQAPGAPVKLTPLSNGAPLTPAAPQTPAPVSPPAGTTATAPGVKVQELAPSDPDGFGVSDPADKVFGEKQWQGTSKPVAAALISRLPAPVISPSLRAVERRLLLRAATAPTGAIPDGPSLIAMRTLVLARIGDGEGADALLHLIPGKDGDEATTQLQLDQFWLAGRNDAACDLLDGKAAAFRGPVWAKAHVACQALKGQKAEAQLGVQLLRDQDVDDPLFGALIDALTQSPQSSKAIPLPAGDWLPIHFALALTAKRDIPPVTLAGADPRVAALIAANTSQPPAVRLAAAERAATLGVLDTATFGDAYAATEGTAAELNAFAKVVKSAATSARGRALVYRTARIEPSPPERAVLVAAGLEAAKGSDLYPATARLYAPLILKFSPAPDVSAQTVEFGRALLIAGELDAAKTWISFAQGLTGQYAAAGPRLWALGKLAGIKDLPAVDAKTLAAWIDADAGQPADLAPSRRAVLIALLSALGETLPSEVFLPSADPLVKGVPLLANPLQWLQLTEASSAKRIAETAALACIVTGGRAGGVSDLVTSKTAVAGLRAIGLDAEAHGFAVEVATASGL